MLNWIFLGLIGGAVITAAFTGTMPKVTEASVTSAKSAVELAIGLIGQMTLWLGFMGVLREAGLLSSMARVLTPVMRRIFPEVPPDHPAMGAMILNISANVLGLGNAATPFGLKAMKELDGLNPKKGVSTNAMALFLVINTSGVAVLPLGVVGVRAALGSRDPAGIIVPSIVATFLSTIVAVVIAKILERLPMFSADRAVVDLTPEAAPAKPADGQAETPEDKRWDPVRVAVMGLIACSLLWALVHQNCGASTGFVQTVFQCNAANPPGITIKTATAPLVTTEAGGTASFTVVLNAAPSSDVIIGVRSSRPQEGNASPSSLTFSSSNWSTPQTVTVTGANDVEADGAQLYDVVTAPALSLDPNYQGRDAADVAMRNTDNEGTTSVAGTDLVRQLMSDWMLPLLMLSIVLVGFGRKVKVYEAFIAAAKEGFQVATVIIPFLVAILVAIGMFRASGAMEAITSLIGPVTNAIGLPAEALPMALIRPMSGSGALAVMTETMKTQGPDSFVGYMVSLINGSSETTFYVLALYFGTVQVRAVRHTLAACLISDALGLGITIALCHVFFGSAA